MPNYPDAILSREVNTSCLLGCLVQSVAFFLKKKHAGREVIDNVYFRCFNLM